MSGTRGGAMNRKAGVGREGGTRRPSRLLLLLVILAILAGTLYPFDFASAGGGFAAAFARFKWFPLDPGPHFPNAGEATSWPDLIVNIVLFLPFGYLLLASLGGRDASGRRMLSPRAGRVEEPGFEAASPLSGKAPGSAQRPGWKRIFLCAFIGALFSAGIEIAQLFAPTRTPAFIDILSNGTGALAGALLRRWSGRGSP